MAQFLSIPEGFFQGPAARLAVQLFSPEFVQSASFGHDSFATLNQPTHLLFRAWFDPDGGYLTMNPRCPF